jgi:glc operon protein GlcG
MKKSILLSLAIITFLATNSIQAQVKTTYQLTIEASQKIMTNALEYAKTVKAPGGSIAIVDAGGNLILFERIDGTFPASAGVAIEKARTSALFKFPSQKFEDAVNGGRVALVTNGYNYLKGGLPIIYKGEVIGAIGLSGSASADQDVEIAKAGAETKID